MSLDSSQEIYSPANRSTEEPPARKGGGLVRTLIYLVVICGVAFLVWRIYQNQKAQQAQAQTQAAALFNRPVPVQVADVDQKPMPIFLTALGTVTPYMSVTVKARVSGELEPVKFTEGQQVRQGETIMVIDPRPYQAALDQAKGTLVHDEALLKNAQAEAVRYKALFDAGVVSKETLEADEAAQGQYEGAIASDKAAIETAQLQLNWCTIQSPIDGKIGLRLVDPGNIISANTTNLVVINQFQPIAVYFTLPENQLPQVLSKLNAERRIPVEAYDRSDTVRIASGQLLTADNQIDTTTGTDKLKAVFDNRNGSLFPNQFVNIHLVLENRSNALVIPSAAIQTGLQGAFVWTAEKDSSGNPAAKIQTVKVALAEGQVTIVDSGVSAGQQVIVDGADRLRPGQLLTVSAQRQGPAQSSSDEDGAMAPASAAGQSPAQPTNKPASAASTANPGAAPGASPAPTSTKESR